MLNKSVQSFAAEHAGENETRLIRQFTAVENANYHLFSWKKKAVIGKDAGHFL